MKITTVDKANNLIAQIKAKKELLLKIGTVEINSEDKYRFNLETYHIKNGNQESSTTTILKVFGAFNDRTSFVDYHDFIVEEMDYVLTKLVSRINKDIKKLEKELDKLKDE